jgi:hypothetical protein
MLVGFAAAGRPAGLGAASLLQPTSATVSWDQHEVVQVNRVTEAIEHAVPRGSEVYSITSDSTGAVDIVWITEAAAWQLELDGRRPGLYSVERACTQPRPRGGERTPPDRRHQGGVDQPQPVIHTPGRWVRACEGEFPCDSPRPACDSKTSLAGLSPVSAGGSIPPPVWPALRVPWCPS